MKKALTTIIILTSFIQLRAQVVPIDTINKHIRTANDLKTGNWQDVFSNFFQLAGSDLTGPNKSFSFSSTLFAIRLKTNPQLNVDTNYVKSKFDRNFQFNTALNLNKAFNFKGFTFGFTWAIANKRDSSLVSIINTKWDTTFSKYATEIATIKESYLREHTVHGVFKNKSDSTTYWQFSNYLIRAQNVNKIVLDSIPTVFRGAISKNISSEYSEVYTALHAALIAAKTKPLLTFSMNGVIDSSGKINSGNASMVFLQGIKTKNNSVEIDARALFSLKDTSIESKSIYRSKLDCKLGVNISLASNKATQASVLEFKPYFEYQHIYSGLLQNEKLDHYLFDADLRIRITNSLWLPITVKYDTHTNNFLGFLNISYNLNSLVKS